MKTSCLLLLAALISSQSAIAACPKPQFAAARLFPANQTAWSAALADLNGDGIKDGIVVNLSSGDVSVLFGNGDGTFQPPVNYAVGPNPTSVLVGDFNGDGVPDLAVAVGASVAVLVGNRDGTFQAPIQTVAGVTVAFIAAGDFNGDRKLDLVTGAGIILLGNGDGTFKVNQIFSQQGIGQVGPVVVGDFNGDGKPDMAVTGVIPPGNIAVGVYVYLGNGDGTFKAPVINPVGGNAGFLAVGDFNRDGKLDLAAVSADTTGAGGVAVLFGKGDGTFQPAVNYNTGIRPNKVAVGDFNGDGFPDLAVSNGIGAPGVAADNISILLNKGDGSFKPAVNYLPNAAGDTYLVAGDLNGDGTPDLFIVETDLALNVAVMLGNGDGTFQAAPSYAVGNGPISTAVGDFNGDGIPDLVVANNGGNSVSVLLARGDGTFQAAVNYTLNASPSAVANVVVADFNGDGNLDLAVATSIPNAISLLFGNGDGTFRPAVTVPVMFGANYVATGDFNGDGKPDLAVLTLIGGVMLLGKGDGTFQTGTSFTVDPDTVLPNIAVGDFNGDGKLDMVISKGGGTSVEVLLGNGDGSFKPPADYVAGTGVGSVAVGDFNGDGKPDLAVPNHGCTICKSPNTLGNVAVLLGNGDGTFQAAVSYLTADDPVFVVAGDFNGDGTPDLAAASSVAPGAVAVLLGNGDGSFQSPLTFGAGFSPMVVAVGDFNVDGMPDLGVVAQGTNSVSVMLNTCGSGSFN